MSKKKKSKKRNYQAMPLVFFVLDLMWFTKPYVGTMYVFFCLNSLLFIRDHTVTSETSFSTSQLLTKLLLVMSSMLAYMLLKPFAFSRKMWFLWSPGWTCFIIFVICAVDFLYVHLRLERCPRPIIFLFRLFKWVDSCLCLSGVWISFVSVSSERI